MKLYEFGPTRSLRVRWTLQELEVPFEAVRVNLLAGEHRDPEFLKINPAAKVPALVDGALVLTESVAIVLYLADKYPEKGLAPATPQQRAELNRWLLFTATELEQPLWRIARNTSLYEECERQPSDIERARRDFRDMAEVAEAHMRSREFVVGERVSVGDFVLAYTLDWANEESLLGDYPSLCQYMHRMYERPRAAMRIAKSAASVGIG